MARVAKTHSAMLTQVLMWYDGPQIILLKLSAIEYVIAVAIDADGASETFLGAGVTRSQLSDYQAGRFDLRYLMSRSARKRWYLCEMLESEQSVRLTVLPRTSEIISTSLPESGLFAASHEQIADVDIAMPSTKERFLIDGSWDLGEFGKFYGQVEDIYSIFSSLDIYANSGQLPSKRAEIREAFARPWRGGGSYLGFYGSMSNNHDRTARLAVSGIQYNSPGYVEMRASKKPFDEMLALLRMFAEKAPQARHAYKTLYEYLRAHNLLSARPDVSVLPGVRDGIEQYTANLAGFMSNVDLPLIEEISGGKIITAKVVLSIFRRVEKLYSFFDQGRVRHADLNMSEVFELSN